MSRVTTKNGLRIGGRGGVMWTKSSLFSGGAHGFLSTIRISKIDMNSKDYPPPIGAKRNHRQDLASKNNHQNVVLFVLLLQDE